MNHTRRDSQGGRCTNLHTYRRTHTHTPEAGRKTRREKNQTRSVLSTTSIQFNPWKRSLAPHQYTGILEIAARR